MRALARPAAGRPRGDPILFTNDLFVLALAMAAHLAFVILLLLTRREPRKDHSLAIAAFLGIVLATALADMTDVMYAIGVWTLPGPNHLVAVMTPLLLLEGPALYFYARALASKEPLRLGRGDLLHLAPYALLQAVTLLLYGLALPGQSGDPALQDFGATLVTQGPLPAERLLTLLVYLPVMTAYVVLAIRELSRHERQKLDYFSNLEGSSLRWLHWNIPLMGLSWGVNLVLLADDLLFDALHPSPLVSLLIFAAWVYPLSFMALWQQPIYVPTRRSPALEAAIATETPVLPAVLAVAAPAGGGAEPRYQRSALDGERMKRIAAKIERTMAQDRLYRNHALNLRNLSDHLKVSENYLSQVLNDYIGSNFYEYVNRWRIREACELLSRTSARIIDIGEDVGFNSRSTFNAAFRKETGQTPSDYRAAVARGDDGASAPVLDPAIPPAIPFPDRPVPL
ncbi:helix-turn-helix transcriptional regulator [Pannonibacter tanglangensis]|uniref:Helix-turn-helix domain-containing protein n=1 Tax=Pannonibacter tanglangensis TaxID=2750084 RepID=A0ABW9ZCL9_9HYPH|nr:helix-turn-helix transcriptional regulator [Pannonibacter sp. XCT-34]NBN62411.1 helix-turn-helix domain-containing protein [Pannonibacter sp. XCT-34]